MRFWERALVAAGTVATTVVAVGLLSVGTAAASISPSLTLDQSAGTSAAGTHDLGMTINFDPSSASDTPKALQIALPPGLIANADVDGGNCLKMTAINPACEVGTGTATASAIVVPATALTPPITAPTTIALTYYLVAPPAKGDLAGLAVSGQIRILGFLPLTTISLGTGDVALRPSGSPNGVGLTISLGLPQQAAGFNASVSSIDSTFDGLRYPSACPSTRARVAVSARSYADSTTKTASAPLTVTKCEGKNAAPYSPTLSVTAVKDSGGRQVTLTTDVKQAADELTSRSTALAFPSKVLVPNLGVASALCPTVSSNCKAIGSATAVSPLYPTPLTGTAYLTGPTALTPDITLVFPQPFSLTLNGAVSLAHNSTTFTGIPDIPLTKLAVTLNGGADGAFSTTCQGATGTATARLVSQNGDQIVNDSSKFTVAGWKACASGGGGNGGGSGGSGGGSGGNGGGSGGNGGGSGSKPSGSKGGRPKLSRGVVVGLQHRRPGVRFTLTKGKSAGKISAMTIALGQGLSFVAHQSHGRLRIEGVTIGGAKVKSLALSNGRLTIRLHESANRITVKLGRKALHESAHLLAQAKHRGPGQLQVNVTVRDAKRVISHLHLRIRELGRAG